MHRGNIECFQSSQEMALSLSKKHPFVGFDQYRSAFLVKDRFAIKKLFIDLG